MNAGVCVHSPLSFDQRAPSDDRNLVDTPSTDLRVRPEAEPECGDREYAADHRNDAGGVAAIVTAAAAMVGVVRCDARATAIVLVDVLRAVRCAGRRQRSERAKNEQSHQWRCD